MLPMLSLKRPKELLYCVLQSKGHLYTNPTPPNNKDAKRLSKAFVAAVSAAAVSAAAVSAAAAAQSVSFSSSSRRSSSSRNSICFYRLPPRALQLLFEHQPTAKEALKRSHRADTTAATAAAAAASCCLAATRRQWRDA